MEVPGFSLRSGSKLRRLSEALREGQFAIGNGRGDDFLRQERETEIRGRWVTGAVRLTVPATAKSAELEGVALEAG